MEVADLHSAIMEKDAEIERLKKLLFDAEAENLQRRQKRARPDTLRSTSIKKDTPLGVMFVHITEDDKGQPFEVFINLGKAGGSAMADAEAVGRLMSLALRSGISLAALHRQLRGISSDRAVGLGPNKVLSVPDAIGLALEDWMKMKQGVQQELLSSSANDSGCSAGVEAAGGDGAEYGSAGRSRRRCSRERAMGRRSLERVRTAGRSWRWRRGAPNAMCAVSRNVDELTAEL